ncbi:hypothetical protein WISP_139406 [Willisornis vidua]|uniref:Uncharacterized protein n=1 Tax=Willisornis vidua TaxID=1566151 RepID=A0ABQ9CT59_9PASS|nr:hypothetical protein WISP_139406 [Willisornis vidua]
MDDTTAQGATTDPGDTTAMGDTIDTEVNTATTASPESSASSEAAVTTNLAATTTMSGITATAATTATCPTSAPGATAAPDVTTAMGVTTSTGALPRVPEGHWEPGHTVGECGTDMSDLKLPPEGTMEKLKVGHRMAEELLQLLQVDLRQPQRPLVMHVMNAHGSEETKNQVKLQCQRCRSKERKVKLGQNLRCLEELKSCGQKGNRTGAGPSQSLTALCHWVSLDNRSLIDTTIII